MFCWQRRNENYSITKYHDLIKNVCLIPMLVYRNWISTQCFHLFTVGVRVMDDFLFSEFCIFAMFNLSTRSIYYLCKQKGAVKILSQFN